ESKPQECGFRQSPFSCLSPATQPSVLTHSCLPTHRRVRQTLERGCGITGAPGILHKWPSHGFLAESESGRVHHRGGRTRPNFLHGKHHVAAIPKNQRWVLEADVAVTRLRLLIENKN